MSANDPFAVFCGGCLERIEGCAGLNADWMHTDTRREACPAGGFARPETAGEHEFRHAQRNLNYRRAS